jgi:hypothetical protein
MDILTDKTPQERALYIIGRYGAIGHRAWCSRVIDQTLRALLGCPLVHKSAIDARGVHYEYLAQGESPEYLAFIGSGPWDKGVTP